HRVPGDPDHAFRRLGRWRPVLAGPSFAANAAGIGTVFEKGDAKPMAKPSWTIRDTTMTIALLGGAVGAAGWIFGMVLELNAAPHPQPANIGVDMFVVLSCAASVLFTGAFVWCLYLFG